MSLPADYARCGDHHNCAHGGKCARALWPDGSVMWLSVVPFHAHWGDDCPEFIARDMNLENLARRQN